MSGTPPCRPQGVSQTLPQQVGILPIALHYFLFVTQDILGWEAYAPLLDSGFPFLMVLAWNFTIL